MTEEQLFLLKAIHQETEQVIKMKWFDDWYAALGCAAALSQQALTNKAHIYINEHLIWIPGSERPLPRGSIDLPPPAF